MQQFLFVTDLDNTLVGDDAALKELNSRLDRHRQELATKIVYATGRSPSLYRQLNEEKQLLPPDALIASVGTEIYLNSNETPEPNWTEQLAPKWDRDLITSIAAHFADLVLQPETEQRPFKVSYYLSEEVAAEVLPRLELMLKENHLDAKLIYSGSQDLDILPRLSDKGLAVKYLQQRWDIDPTQTVVCGDSGNDISLFSVGEERGIIVGNARPELRLWHDINPAPSRYLANANYAQGILEGLMYFGFL